MIVNSEALRRAFKIASKAIRNHGVLSFCRVTAANGSGRVSGTNMELWCAGSFACEGEFDSLVDAKRLSAWLATIPDDQAIVIELHGTLVVAKSETAIVQLPTITEPFPEWNATTGASAASASLAAQITRAVSMNEDGTTQRGTSLGGLSIEIEDGVVYLSSTDGRAVSTVGVIADTAGGPAGGKAPEQFCRTVASLAPRDAPITVSISKDCISATWDGAEVQTLQLDGNPKRVRQVANTYRSEEQFISVPAAVFRNLIERARVTADDGDHAVSVSVKDGTLVIYSRTSAGESSSEVPVASGDLEYKKLINSKYLLAICRQCEPAETVEFRDVPNVNCSASEFRLASGVTFFVAGLADD